MHLISSHLNISTLIITTHTRTNLHLARNTPHRTTKVPIIPRRVAAALTLLSALARTARIATQARGRRIIVSAVSGVFALHLPRLRGRRGEVRVRRPANQRVVLADDGGAARRGQV
jgi:hypothetical protein